MTETRTAIVLKEDGELGIVTLTPAGTGCGFVSAGQLQPRRSEVLPYDQARIKYREVLEITNHRGGSIIYDGPPLQG